MQARTDIEMRATEQQAATKAETGAARASARKAWSAAAQVKWFGLAVFVFCVVYAKAIDSWARFAWHSDLYSHVLLIPFVALYFAWQKRRQLVKSDARGRTLAAIPAGAGLALLAWYWVEARTGVKFTREDALCIWVFSFLGLIYGTGIWLLGRENLRRFSVSAIVLVFAAPFPSTVLEGIESFLQQGSAWVAHGLFWISGMPCLRVGTFFQLPGMPLNVAPECSGIHSTLVLFITSILAGHIFLKSGWRRRVLAVAVIPLALVRNAFRIFTIGQLCVQIGPEMIHSYIHRKGGPIFFVLSLIPFFALLVWMVTRERRGEKAEA